LRQAQGQNFGYTLARLGYISDAEITNFLSQQYRVPTINLEEYEIDAEIRSLCRRSSAKHRVIPVSLGQLPHRRDIDQTNLHAIDDPSSSPLQHRARHAAGAIAAVERYSRRPVVRQV
jgi:type IV pilus assembly protein PilB